MGELRRDERAISAEPALDTLNQCLWLADERVELTPKAYALLLYLAERPGRLVTKDELLERLWAGTVVTDGVLKVCVRELRVALRDDARSPRWIETRHRRGYAFLRELPRRTSAASAARPAADAPAPEGASLFVGREAELEELRRARERAPPGERGIGFVGGSLEYRYCVAEKLLTFGLHRAPRSQEQCALDELLGDGDRSLHDMAVDAFLASLRLTEAP